MKKIMIAAVVLFSSFAFSQEVKPKFEAVDGMVKATYFYDNGQVKEQGFYLDGKLHGKWVSYNEDGSKQTLAEYSKGMKVGKWFFWNSSELTEVDYSNSQVADVKHWTKDALAGK